MAGLGRIGVSKEQKKGNDKYEYEEWYIGEWGFAGYESGYYFFKGGRCYQYVFGSCGGDFFP